MAIDPLEQLIQMASEVDELERTALRAAGAAAVAANIAPRAADWNAASPRIVSRGEQPRASGPRAIAGWVLGVGAALAAGLALSVLVRPNAGPARPTIGPMSLRYVPTERLPLPLPPTSAEVQRRMAVFPATTAEPLAMMAVLRGWNRECQCVAWRLYHWADGEWVTRADGGHPSEIALDMTGAPPVDQLLVVAAASERGELPDEQAEADALLACLNDSPVPPEAEGDMAALATTVRSCLPAGVAVVPQRFVVGGPSH